MTISYDYRIDREALDRDARRLLEVTARQRRATLALERAAEQAKKAAEQMRAAGGGR